ncbi:unnamed protein product [Mytilus edulis]|uniref:Uncharacterized protein n=1 Tax=Mytilus edulis TaxID=6550 RepID=A0A8S3VEJ8_MYTED|nr:unnamed protein product [Mytilus edulis]
MVRNWFSFYRPGILGSIMKEVKHAGREVEKGLNWAGNQIDHTVKQCETGKILSTPYDGAPGKQHTNKPNYVIILCLTFLEILLPYNFGTTQYFHTFVILFYRQTFQTNNVVQLVSRASGRSLQIVMSPTQQLVIDGCGAEGPQAFNTLWTVVNESNNQVRLHNNNNYIAIVNGLTQLVHMSTPYAGAPAKQ